MTVRGCERSLQSIVSDLGARFVVEQSRDLPEGTTCVVRTPFLYPDNSPITFYVTRTDEGLELSDQGDASDYAFLHGIAPGSIRNRIRKTAKRLGIEAGQSELTMVVNESDAGDAAAVLIGAMLEVGSLVREQARSQPRREFKQDVESFFVQQRWPYATNVEIEGRSHRRRTVDYLLDPPGARHLNIWTFDPSPRAAGKRADDIAISFLDVSDPSAPDADQFLVLLPPIAVTDVDRGDFGDALALLKYRGPRLVEWDERHLLSDLLQAA